MKTEKPKPKILKLECCCCGCLAPAYKQWWNRDTGYGACKRCFDDSVAKYGLEVSEDYYGKAGVHHSLVL